MRVIVGKMPGGRAQEVNLPEGGTVFDAIKAAGYESDLNAGFEARVNNSMTELSSPVSENAIITLTEKIKGNGLTAIGVVPVGTSSSYQKFLAFTPTIIHDFINVPDVKDMLLRLSNTIADENIQCVVVDPEEAKVFAPVDIVVYNETVICSDTSVVIEEGDYVVFCSEATAEAIFQKDPISAITYVEEYIPEGDKNPNSLGASKLPEEVKEIEVTEDCDCGCNENCADCDCEDDCATCSVTNACDCECEEESCCGHCDDTLPEDMLTIAELTDMCNRLGIDISICIPGARHREMGIR